MKTSSVKPNLPVHDIPIIITFLALGTKLEGYITHYMRPSRRQADLVAVEAKFRGIIEDYHETELPRCNEL